MESTRRSLQESSPTSIKYRQGLRSKCRCRNWRKAKRRSGPRSIAPFTRAGEMSLPLVTRITCTCGTRQSSRPEIGDFISVKMTAMNREPNQREKELCQQISAETDPHRFLALVTELNDLLQNQPAQELPVQTRSDAISGSRFAEGK